MKGDKSILYQEVNYGDRPAMVRQLLEAGIAVASANYRLLAPDDTIGVINALMDGKRCVQTIRLWADSLGIQPDKVGIWGSSAGAGIALWLGFHSDMAVPTAAEAWERESTRLHTLALNEPQASLNIYRWEDEVFHDYWPYRVKTIMWFAKKQLLPFYGLADKKALNSPNCTAYRDSIDALHLLSPDDPEFFLRNVHHHSSFPLNLMQFLHHPYHGRALKREAVYKGVPCVAWYGETTPQPEEHLIPFLIQKLVEE